MFEIECMELKDVDLKGGTIIEGSPGVGVVSAIAATFLIDHFKMDQVCAFDSDGFPATSVVHVRKPKFPARIYVSNELNVGVFISEFTPSPEVHRPMARTVMDWCQKHGCGRIISTEAIPAETGAPESPKDDEREVRIRGVGSTDSAREDLEKAGITQLETGSIVGVSGILLNLGRWRNFDVITLLVEALESQPDAYAAARLIETMDVLMPEFKIDTGPLHAKAKVFEEHIQKLRRQSEPAKPPAPDHMYG